MASHSCVLAAKSLGRGRFSQRPYSAARNMRTTPFRSTAWASILHLVNQGSGIAQKSARATVKKGGSNPHTPACVTPSWARHKSARGHLTILAAHLDPWRDNKEHGLWRSRLGMAWACGDRLNLRQTLQTLVTVVQESRTMRGAWLAVQLVANIGCLVLYVMGTYGGTEPANGTFRAIEICFSAAFALQYFVTIMTADSKLRTVTKPAMLFDPLTWAPTLLSAVIQETYALLPDFRWMRVFRALRVIRVVLLTEPHLAKQRFSGVDWVLFQVAGSILVLLFSCASVVQLIEQIPWHDALYFIVTTFTTVGFGDFVPTTVFSRMTVCAMMLIGVVVIPVQASQIYARLQRRKNVLGPLPRGRGSRQAFVLVSGRISSLKGFVDFFNEFFHEINASDLQPDTRMVCLSDTKPTIELRAFQELNEQRMTVMEGSGLMEEHLVRARAQASSAVLLLCDRLTTNARAEDLRLLFQVWALKSYTKSVPLYIQALQEEAVSRIAPFLDVQRDVVLSVERIRYYTLALSCVCPGASTLLGNLLRRAEIPEERFLESSMAGRQWLREYANGCAWGIYQVDIKDSDLVGRRFLDVTACIYAETGCTLIGLNVPDGVLLNPGVLLLRKGDKALLLARSFEQAQKAVMTVCKPLEAIESRGDMPSKEDLAANNEKHVLYKDKSTSRALSKVSAAPLPVFLQSDSGSDSDSFDDSGIGMEETKADDAGRDDKEVWINGSSDYGPFPDVDGFNQPEYIPRPVADSYLGESVLDMKDTDIWGQMGYEALVTSYPEKGKRSNSTSSDPAAVPAAMRRGRILHVHREGSLLAVAFGGCGSIQCRPEDELVPLRRDASKHASVMEVIEPFLQPEESVTCSPGNGMTDHFILCGCEESMPGFLKALCRCDDDCLTALKVVVVSTSKPKISVWAQIQEVAPGAFFHRGNPSDPMVLREVNAGRARSIIHLANIQNAASQNASLGRDDSGRDGGSFSEGAPTFISSGDGAGSDVLADTDALLLCYGVGEVQQCTFAYEEKQDLVHTVVELCLTSSVKFLQPGLLLRGYADEGSGLNAGRPRQSWLLRKAQEKALKEEGMAPWQANAYYASGRVSLPAIIDTFSCASFFNGGLMVDILEELCGEIDIPAGALLKQVEVPPHLRSSTYGDLHAYLVQVLNMVPLGLHRRKARNWKLPYVATNPSPETRLHPGDRVFVLRERLAPDDLEGGRSSGGSPPDGPIVFA